MFCWCYTFWNNSIFIWHRTLYNTESIQQSVLSMSFLPHKPWWSYGILFIFVLFSWFQCSLKKTLMETTHNKSWKHNCHFFFFYNSLISLYYHQFKLFLSLIIRLCINFNNDINNSFGGNNSVLVLWTRHVCNSTLYWKSELSRTDISLDKQNMK